MTQGIPRRANSYAVTPLSPTSSVESVVGPSRRELETSIVAKLESAKNIAWDLDGRRFDVLPVEQINRALERFTATLEKVDRTVWDMAVVPGRHKNPLHWFRQYTRTERDLPGTATLSRSARILHDSLTRVDSALGTLLEATSALSGRKPSEADILALADLQSTVRSHLDAIRESLPTSKNRFNLKTLMTGLLVGVGVALAIGGIVASGGTLGIVLAVIGVVLTIAGAVNTTLNQRFYQRDRGWDTFESLINKLHDLTINQLDQRMHSVNSYHVQASLGLIQRDTTEIRSELAQFRAEQGAVNSLLAQDTAGLRSELAQFRVEQGAVNSQLAKRTDSFSTSLADTNLSTRGIDTRVLGVQSSLDDLNRNFSEMTAAFAEMRRDFANARPTGQ
ncbi:hypothetical protein [Pandoraea pnomenusa]|uniref:hypothetical protein n=1 Tax=Pandoraea pnomenusa TaxID=93220 RepID=UPI0033408A45